MRGREVNRVFVDLRMAFDLGRFCGSRWRRWDKGGNKDKADGGLQGDSVQGKSRRKVGESFWTARGVKQECPLSMKLFSLLIADLDEWLERRSKGGGRRG